MSNISPALLAQSYAYAYTNAASNPNTDALVRRLAEDDADGDASGDTVQALAQQYANGDTTYVDALNNLILADEKSGASPSNMTFNSVISADGLMLQQSGSSGTQLVGDLMQGAPLSVISQDLSAFGVALPTAPGGGDTGSGSTTSSSSTNSSSNTPSFATETSGMAGLGVSS